MRGRAKKQASMLAFVDPETLIPADHPLRTIKRFADAALLELSPLFDEMYAADGEGRASIPPERLLKASLLISLYSVRSERAFCEELTYHLLFRWFLDMDMVSPASTTVPSPRTVRGSCAIASVASSSTRWCCRPIACIC
jgi:transposase